MSVSIFLKEHLFTQEPHDSKTKPSNLISRLSLVEHIKNFAAALKGSSQILDVHFPYADRG